MAGGATGLIAMFLPWFHFTMPLGTFERSGVDSLAAIGSIEVLCATAFLAGSFLAFLNSYGGLLQLAGVGGFSTHLYLDIGFQSWGLGPGIYLAFLSAVVVSVSIVVPIGFGWREKKGMRSPLKMNIREANTVVANGDPKIELNDLCLLGAVLGVFVLTATPWTTESPHYDYGRLINRIYVDIDRNVVYHAIVQGMGAGPAIILAAGLLMFATSLAVLFLIGGVVIFFDSATKAAAAGSINHIGSGFVLILLPASLAVASIVLTLLESAHTKRRPSWMDFLNLRLLVSAKV